MEVFVWIIVIVLVLMILVCIGAGVVIFWDESPNFAEFVVGLGSPLKGHKIVEKEKRPSDTSIRNWKYWWKCECGKEDWEFGMFESFRTFLGHRSYERNKQKIEQWKAKDKTARKGWF